MAQQSASTHSARHQNEWHITQCACGEHLTLRLGPIRMDLTNDEFADLHRLIEEAMFEFRIPARDLAGTPFHSSRH
jgi:hypothetical protein